MKASTTECRRYECDARARERDMYSDKVMRLEAENDQLRQQLLTVDAERLKYSAEVGRLRAALEAIAEEQHPLKMAGNPEASMMQFIAREALK